MKEEMWNYIEKLSELRSRYSCFNDEEEPFYRALSLGIKGIKALEQEPILDKIRAEIERQEKWLMDAGYNAYNVDIAFSSIKLVVNKYKTELEIIDNHISGKENTNETD